ncbi:unnamed protein product [Microthlaspi erraticum]|uniref:F-box domain-containing protein n=1 Tax=Microthlaspi erraticum TaxID=1685480 RepID=A0A6D2LCC2_9BRAS|nr:unnamed protein product [Microthlaspi erraticum]
MMSYTEEPAHKTKKMELSPSSSLLSSLPDDVAMNCLARVSRLEHASLSMASKSYRSLVASPDLYKTRSLMGRTETYTYVCLRTPPPNPSPRWYILRRKNGSSDLMPIPGLPTQAPEASSVAVLGWGIYVMGGLIEGKPTSDVWLLDCRTHKWRRVPSMGVARAEAAVGVIGGKIYVLGGCKYDDRSLSWGEVFDPMTQTWDALPPMPVQRKHDEHIHCSVVRDQEIYGVVETDRTFYYSASEGKWGRGNRVEAMGNRRDFCMIDGLLYCIFLDGTIFWSEADELDRREPEGMVSKQVKGLLCLKESLARSRLVHFGDHFLDRWDQNRIKFGFTQRSGKSHELEDLLSGDRLRSSGRNMLLFWDVVEGGRLEIWCAEISLERLRQGGNVWGNTEWSSAVLTLDPFLGRYKVLHSVSVTL